MNMSILYNSLTKEYNKYKENNLVVDFKKKYSLEERKNKYNEIIKKYPDKCPIICYTSPELPNLKNSKFLVGSDLVYTNFLFSVRKNMDIKPEESIYMFINNKLMSSNKMMADIYENNHDEDGFLYVYICSENTFG